MQLLRMRWRAAGAAIRRGLRRTGVQALIAAAAVGAGAGLADGLAAVAALLGWSVLPLARATAEGAVGASAALLGQVVLGLLWLRLWQPALWSAAWREAERALPIVPASQHQADLALMSAVLVPLWLVQGAGWCLLAWQQPPWWQGARLASLGVWVLAQLLSLALFRAYLKWLRGRGRRGVVARRPFVRAPGRRVHTLAALFGWPLWRGPARGLGRALLLASVAAPLPALAAQQQPADLPWAGAVASGLLLFGVLRLAALARQQWVPLLAQAAQALPLRRSTLQRAARALVLVPAGLTIGLLVAVAAGLPATRGAVLAAWAGLAALAAWWLAGDPPEEAGWAAARVWLLGSLLVALASEMR